MYALCREFAIPTPATSFPKSVSVIGLGSPTDSDAKFLEDIASRGNGRIFFNADPSQLPALFAQETVAIARSIGNRANRD